LTGGDELVAQGGAFFGGHLGSPAGGGAPDCAHCAPMPPPRPLPELAAHTAELLSSLGPVQVKRMFGGHGYYVDGVFLALSTADQLYLKADDTTAPRFAQAGCEPFTYTAKDRKQVTLGYWTAAREDGAREEDGGHEEGARQKGSRKETNGKESGADEGAAEEGRGETRPRQEGGREEGAQPAAGTPSVGHASADGEDAGRTAGDQASALSRRAAEQASGGTSSWKLAAPQPSITHSLPAASARLSPACSHTSSDGSAAVAVRVSHTRPSVTCSSRGPGPMGRRSASCAGSAQAPDGVAGDADCCEIDME
jgi:TfoX/Sxy family transcriptional regulator of competence genes